MTTFRSAKNKGASFEYDCVESLQQIYPEAYLTKQRGFQLMFDIQDDKSEKVWECKRLAGISWNRLNKLHKKLRSVSPDGYTCKVLFQSNRQPCLVFDGITIVEFKTAYGVDFKKHTPVRRGKKDDNPQKDLS